MAAYSYSIDSQLMRHHTPDGLHSASETISAVYDENQHPMVFSIVRSSKRLALTMADANTGQNVTIDLSTVFGFRRPITHVAAFQDDAGLVYVAFAERGTQAADIQNLHICAGAEPAAWRDPSKLKNLIIPKNGVGAVKLVDLFFVPSANAGTFFHDSNYPVLITETDESWKNDPSSYILRRVKVPFNTGKWQLIVGELAFPTTGTNRISVIDKAVLSTTKQTISLATLYKVVGDTKIQLSLSFYNTSSGGKISFKDYNLPQGAQCLAVTRNQTGLKTNDLLVLANGLYHYNSEMLQNSMLTPKYLSLPTQKLWNGVQNVITCQSGGDIVMWFQNAQQIISTATLSYAKDSLSASASPPVPIHADLVQAMSPVFRSDSISPAHHLLLLNTDGTHLLLQYKPKNGVWEEQPWIVRDPSLKAPDAHFYTVVAYNSHLVVENEKGYKACNAQLYMSSEDIVTATVNGKRIVLGPYSQAVQTDGRGCISLITPVDSLGSSSQFQLWHNQDKVGDLINPAAKINAALANVNGGNLADEKLQTDGHEKLVTGDADTVKEAGSQIQQLHASMASLRPSGGSNGPRPESIFGDAWNAWHYIERTNPLVKDFKKVANEIHMVMDVVGEATTFVVDSVGKALKAVSYVLKKLAVDIARIVDWIGYIFEWNDIKKTQEALVATTKVTFDRIEDWAESLADKIDGALESADEMFNTMLDQMKGKIVQSNGAASNFYATLQTGSQKQTSKATNICPDNTHDMLGRTSNSPGSQWSANQFGSGNIVPPIQSESINPKYLLQRHGGEAFHNSEEVLTVMGSGLWQQEVIYPKLMLQSRSSISEPVPDGVDALLAELDPILDDAKKTMGKLITNLSGVMKSNPENIGQNIMETIIDFAEDVLETFKDILKAVLRVAKKLVGPLFRWIFASPIQIPFLSALWKFEGKSEESLPGVLDIYCLLLAIPTTAVGKIMGEVLEVNTDIWGQFGKWTEFLEDLKFDDFDPKNALSKLTKTIAEPTIMEAGRSLPSPQIQRHVNGELNHTDLRREKSLTNGIPAKKAFPFDDELKINGGHTTSAHRQDGRKKGDSNGTNPSARADPLFLDTYTKMCIVVHPTMTFTESLIHMGAGAARFSFSKLKLSDATQTDIMKTFNTLEVIAEAVALAFSFPNVEDFQEEATGLASGAGSCELIAFITRIMEITGAGVFLTRPTWERIALGELVTAFSAIMTLVETLCVMSSCVLHAIDIGITKPEGWEVLEIANGIAFANAISSIAMENMANLAELTDEWYIDAFAAAAGLVDTALDAGRGGFEWKESKSIKHQVVSY